MLDPCLALLTKTPSMGAQRLGGIRVKAPSKRALAEQTCMNSHLRVLGLTIWVDMMWGGGMGRPGFLPGPSEEATPTWLMNLWVAVEAQRAPALALGWTMSLGLPL